MAIISVEKEYKSTKSWQDYRTEIEITYGGKNILMNIGKVEDNFDKDRRSKCFNCNIYKYMAKNCWKLKKK